MLKRIGAARRKILTVWRLLQGKPEVIRAFSKLMERHALVQEAVRAEAEDAEYMRRVMDSATGHTDQGPAGSSSLAAAASSEGGRLHASASSLALASPQTTLRRSTQSSTAINMMAGGTGGAVRRKDVPLWPAYITAGMATSKDHPRLSSTRPSTADLSNQGVFALRGNEPELPVTAGEVARYLSDVYDHLVSLVGSSSHCDMVLSRAHSNYLARISLELGESTVETNLFASRWTVIGAILVPLNVVTGLWGMNVT
ncbi:CorA metal ion transporter, partial [Coemansia sp. Benny D115]